MPYIANKPGTAFRSFTDKDTFTGDGSTTAFDMQFAIDEAGLNDLRIYVNDVLQVPTDDYTLGVDDAGDYKRITFTSAPTNGHVIVILNPGTVRGGFATVADNAITSTKLNTEAITGQTELAEQAADTDTYLIHDASTNSLKKIQASNVTPNETLITGKTTLSASDVATDDLILVYDTSAGTLKKIAKGDLVASTPVFTSITPSNALSGDGTGNYSFDIVGTGFESATVKFIGADATEYTADTTTTNTTVSITAVIAKSSLPASNEPFDIKILNSNGLSFTSEDELTIDAQPVWVTASGTLGTFDDSDSISVTVAATDPESGSISYSLESGTLPSGISLNSSTGVISGTAPAIASTTTYSFTIRASDSSSNTADRSFTITINETIVSGGQFN
jgi:hypothetical protein